MADHIVQRLYGLLGLKMDKEQWKAAEKALDGLVSGLTRVAKLGAVALAGAGAGAVALSETYTGLENRLRQVTSGQEHLAEIMDKTRAIANATRSDWHATGEAYVRLTNATKDLELSEERRLSVLETLNMALQSSGASANEAAAGTLQLMQGLSSGALQGDEFRSIAEQLPDLLDLFAKELGVSRGELKKMGSEGKITSKVVVSALENASGAVREKFAASTSTAAQQWTVLKNSLTLASGEFIRSSGLVSGLSKVVDRASKWIEAHRVEIAKFGEQVGAAMGLAFDAISAVVGWLIDNGDVTISIVAALGSVLVYAGVSAAAAWIAAAWPILAIAAAIAAVIWVAQDLYKAFTGGNSRILKLWNRLSDRMKTIMKTVGAILFAPFIAVVAVVVKIVSAVRRHWGSIVDAVTGFGASIRDAIVGAFDWIVEEAKKLPGRVWRAIKSIPGDLWDAITGEDDMTAAVRQEMERRRAGGPVYERAGASSSVSVGDTTIVVNGAGNPSAVGREVARHTGAARAGIDTLELEDVR